MDLMGLSPDAGNSRALHKHDWTSDHSRVGIGQSTVVVSTSAEMKTHCAYSFLSPIHMFLVHLDTGHFDGQSHVKRTA